MMKILFSIFALVTMVNCPAAICFSAPLNSLYRQELLSLGPVAYYGLDESTGATIAMDEISPASDGTIAAGVTLGGSAAYPSLGTSANFDGNPGSNIDLGNPVKLQNNAMSVVFWMNAATSGDGIITKGKSRSGTTDRDWDIFGNGSTLRFLGSSGTGYIFNVGVSFPTLDQWHLVAATWDGTTAADGVKIYLDGTLAGQGASSGTALSTARNIFLGGNSSAYTFDGELDEVAFFDAALGGAEIAGLYALRSEVTTVPEPNTLFLSSVLISLLTFRRRGRRV